MWSLSMRADTAHRPHGSRAGGFVGKLVSTAKKRSDSRDSRVVKYVHILAFYKSAMVSYGLSIDGVHVLYGGGILNPEDLLDVLEYWLRV